MSWKTLQSKIIIKNKFFTLTKDRCQKSNGEIIGDYFSIFRPEAAIVAAFTEKMELIMINQYRYPVKSLDLELPAGYIEPKEKNIAQAAARELLEETGFKAGKLIRLQKSFASAGFLTNSVYFFIAFNCQKIQEQKLDKSEEIGVKITPWKKVSALLEKGKIKDMGSVCGILLATEYFKNHNVRP